MCRPLVTTEPSHSELPTNPERAGGMFSWSETAHGDSAKVRFHGAKSSPGPIAADRGRCSYEMPRTTIPSAREHRLADPTIISCAVTGNITTLQQTPHLPCTPEQIANSC